MAALGEQSRPGLFAIAAAGTVVVIASLGYWNIRQLRISTSAVAHTHEVVTSLERTLSAIKDAEAGQRGFLLTEAPYYLAPYDAGVEAIPVLLERLRHLTQDDPAHQAQLAQLKLHIARKLSEMNRTIEVCNAKGHEAARQIVLSDEGQKQMEFIRQVITAMIFEENIRLQFHLQKSNEAYRNATVFGGATTGISMLGILIALVYSRYRWKEQHATARIRSRLAAIAESSHDAIIGKTLQGIITSCNPAAERLFGYTAAELVGTSIFSLVPPDRIEEEQSAIRRVSEGEVIRQLETSRICKDGKSVAVLLNLSPIYDSHRTIVGISTIAQDITQKNAQKQALRESEERFRDLADNMSQLAWMADAKGWVFWYNQRWYEYTGTDLSTMQGWGWTQVHHPDHLDRVVQRLQYSWDTGEPWEDTFPIRGRDGTYRWFLSRALAIRDENGHVTRWFGSNTDVTGQKEIEQSLQQARDVAEAANQARGEFLANMSHEIRTPMTAILGHADILAENLVDPDNQQCVATIRTNGEFLLQIINDILDLSKIDAGKLQIDTCQVSPVLILKDIYSLMVVRAQEKHLTLDVEVKGAIPKEITTDPIRLRQILLNLVGNAIKFTNQGGVRIVVQYLAEADCLQCEVCDTGIGIAAEACENIFREFTQADSSSTRTYGGTGLGLSISRRLARALGGDVTLRTKPGVGSTFTVTISAGAAADIDYSENHWEMPGNANAINPSSNIDAVILVIDDRRDIRFLIQHFIEKAGGTVVTATNGKEGVEQLLSMDPQSQNIDLVLMDMQMPVMDGYQAVETLRSKGFLKPIIALTANAMKDDRIKCLEIGCNDYLTKPLNGVQLIAMVAKYVNRCDRA